VPADRTEQDLGSTPGQLDPPCPRYPPYKSAEKDGAWLIVLEAAERRGVTSHRLSKLIRAGILPAEQVVPGAPFKICATDLDAPSVAEAAGRNGRPCHIGASDQRPMFPDI